MATPLSYQDIINLIEQYKNDFAAKHGAGIAAGLEQYNKHKADPGSPSDPTNPIDYGSNNWQFGQVFDDRNQQVGSSSQNITDLLRTIFGTYAPYSDEWAREDTGNFINWLKLLNERQYNENMRDEQRAYDSPTQLLQRLMSTGMTRAAALQILQSGLGGASSSPITSPAATPQDMDYDASALQQQRASTAINAAMSLMSFGLNASAALQTASLAAAQAQSQQMANDAQQCSTTFNSAMYQRSLDGLFDPSVTSFDDAVKMFKNDEDIKPLLTKMLGTTGAYQICSQNYNTRFSNTDKLSEILFNQQMRSIQEDVAQIDLEKAILELDWNEFKFEDYQISRDDVNAYNALNFKRNLQILVQTSDPDTLRKEVEIYKNDKAFQSYYTAFRMRMQEAQSSLLNTPEYLNAAKICNFLDNIGFNGVIGDAVKVIGMTAGGLEGSLLRFRGTSQDEFSSSIGDFYNSITQPFANFESWFSKQAKKYFGDLKKSKPVITPGLMPFPGNQ